MNKKMNSAKSITKTSAKILEEALEKKQPSKKEMDDYEESPDEVEMDEEAIETKKTKKFGGIMQSPQLSLIISVARKK